MSLPTAVLIFIQNDLRTYVGHALMTSHPSLMFLWYHHIGVTFAILLALTVLISFIFCAVYSLFARLRATGMHLFYQLFLFCFVCVLLAY